MYYCESCFRFLFHPCLFRKFHDLRESEVKYFIKYYIVYISFRGGISIAIKYKQNINTYYIHNKMEFQSYTLYCTNEMQKNDILQTIKQHNEYVK